MFDKKRLLALLFLSAGFLTTVYLTWNRIFTGLDTAATRILQNAIPRSLDLPFSTLSLLASTEIVGLIMLGIAALVYVKFNKVFWGLGMMVLIYIVEILGKYFIYHPGPLKEFFRYAIPFTFPHYVATNYSFPSGHVSRTFFLVVIGAFLIHKLNLTPGKSKILYTIFVLLTVAMVVSRVYLGEHWFSDTVGGAFLGSLIGVAAIIAY